MSEGSLPYRTRATAAPVVAVLLLTLVVAGVITWIALLSTASHRAAAEDALRDYAQFATDNFTSEASKVMYGGSLAILSSVGAGTPNEEADHLYAPEVMQKAAQDLRECRCMYVPNTRYVFRYQPATHQLDLRGDTLPGEDEWARLVDSLSSSFDTVAAKTAGHQAWPGVLYVIFDPTADDARIFMTTYVRGVGGAPDAVYGFASTFRGYADSVLPRLAETTPLLPKSLSRGLPNDSLVAVTARDASGEVIYRSPARSSMPYAATQPLWRWFPTGPTVELALRPQATSVLLRGGVPKTRLPLLLALLVCAGVLVLLAWRFTRRAEELAQVRADFTSSVSHELRTPLAQIVLFAESLAFRRVSGDTERENAARIILREAHRLTHLVDNLLLFSRTERRATHVSARPRELAPIIRDVAESFGPLARVRHSSLALELDERVVAPVDAGALRQILLNLLDNAVKYGPEGQTVRVSLVLDGTRALVRVDDEGRGVADADSERIWEPFVRLHSGEYSVATGSGIGLSVVRQLARLHGGTCRASHTPEGGGRFEVEFPGAQVASHVDGGSHDLAVAR